MSYKIISYNYTIPSASQLDKCDEIIAGYMRPNSPTDMTLVNGAVADGDGATITTMVNIMNAVHAAGKKCTFQLYAPWISGSNAWNQVFASTILQDTLFTNIIAFLKRGFDGINFDYESDNEGGGSTPTNVNNFYKRLFNRMAIEVPGKTISATENFYGAVTMLTETANYLDWIGGMTYDVAAPWYGTLADVATWVNKWKAVIPAVKLIPGAQFGALLDNSWNPNSNYRTYAQIIAAYNPAESLNMINNYYYNGADLVEQKAIYVRDNSLGGMFCYTVSADIDSNLTKSLLLHIYNILGNITPPPPPPVTYAVNISVSGQGTTNPAPATYTVNAGQTMTVTAMPDSGYQLDHWAGDISGTTNQVSFSVNSNMSIQAVFVQVMPPPPTTGTIKIDTVPTGATILIDGITQDVAPITRTLSIGSHVVATSLSGYQDSSRTINIVAGDNGTLTITLLPVVTYLLKVTVIGQGQTDLAVGSYNIPAGQTVTMRAIADTGWKFRSWSWPSNPDPNYAGWPDNPTSWTMVESIAIVAIFDQIVVPPPPTQYAITVSAGTGGTTIPAPGTYTVNSGGQIAVTAKPRPNYKFNKWSGSIISTNPIVTLTVTKNASVTANFYRRNR